MLTPRDELLDEINQGLCKPPLYIGHPAAIGRAIYKLLFGYGRTGAKEQKHWQSAYRAYLKAHSSEDVAKNQIDYALRLIDAKRGLMYEEIHKLFSLIDEIEALKRMGIKVDEAAYSGLQSEFRKWCDRQRKNARLVAEDKAQDWNRSWW